MILALWLLFQQMVGDALLVAPLPFVVLTFRYFCREAYADPSLTMSLDEAVARDADVWAGNKNMQHDFNML